MNDENTVENLLEEIEVLWEALSSCLGPYYCPSCDSKLGPEAHKEGCLAWHAIQAYPLRPGQLSRVEVEREACALLAETYADKQEQVAAEKSEDAPASSASHLETAWAGRCIAKAIRARGKKA